MKIDRIELFHVAMPLITPWRTAYGEDADIHSILCRMCSGSVDGWAGTRLRVASPLAAPCYSSEWAGGAFAVIRDWLAPRVIGQDVSSGEQLGELLSIYKGNSFAKAALDTAWWSLLSKLSGVPLYRALGATRDHVSVGADFGVMDHLDDLLQEIRGAAEQSFPRVKLRFRPGWDLAMLEAVRASFPNLTIYIDCNSGYRRHDAALFREIDRFDLAMIEQPLAHDDLWDHAPLQRQLVTPLCLDESVD